ncbi:unnamed protein product [Notodromas monacha]|uniref:Anion exchange protein n=1 Tax=Notodromas monacha TaxID=399045 RepID=A0A7R9BWG3_9CRUS|nr:unnamed protein product [Notodromas monacha]CAG0922055.1 unnamed protein product [Notodromas monacha]
MIRKNIQKYAKRKNVPASKEAGPQDRIRMRTTKTWAGTSMGSMEDYDLEDSELTAETGGSNAPPTPTPCASRATGPNLLLPPSASGTSEQSSSLEPSATAVSLQNGSLSDVNDGGMTKANTHFMRKLPPDVEASNIMIGELDFLERPIMAFIRLNNSTLLGDLTEVPVPTRFLCFVLGPPDGRSSRYREIGRSMATLMSDEIFHVIAYKAKRRDHLLAGLDEFLDSVTILPPGEWDPAIRIEPPNSIPSQEPRKHGDVQKEKIDEEDLERKLREEAGLTRTGRLFGGLINDVKRKWPWYLSDFTDALSVQCVASWIFLYFACLTPIITFGGLLGEATGNNMAAMESLVSGAVVGVTYALFSGQPLTILGSTGPVLVFETILYDFCSRNEWEYLSFRMCIGIWVGILLVLMVALDLSYTVCYITRFTEENFACLIAFIFIYKVSQARQLNAIEKVILIGEKYPINTSGHFPDYTCRCNSTNETIQAQLRNDDPFNGQWGLAPKDECELKYDGILFGSGCDTPVYQPDVFLMSILLFMGTFTVSVILKNIRSARFFPTKVRSVMSDFAVIIAIGSMSLLDYVVNIKTPKLTVPSTFAPTLPDRGWVVTPLGGKNPFWSPLAAFLPALLAVILIFMDQQITAVIVNRKENRLKVRLEIIWRPQLTTREQKGCGYHLDLFVLALLIIVCSCMGIPWFVAATVLSINHVNSLKMESECAAPGEKPQFLGVREQRVTPLLIFLTIGLSVFLTSVLKHIPMPVLFGVFLYMGVSSLNGLQFFDRLMIMFMPPKYQPDYYFLRQVPLKRVHIFTLIQLVCFAVLWIIKSFKQTSILFPIMLVVMIAVRKILDFQFKPEELKVLDDLMPDFKRRTIEEKDEDEDGADDGDIPPDGKLGSLRMGPSGNLSIPLANGNIMKIPANVINISEELDKSGVWKHVNSENDLRANGKGESKARNRAANEKGSSDEHKRLSHVPEEDEDDVGITIKLVLVNHSAAATF